MSCSWRASPKCRIAFALASLNAIAVALSWLIDNPLGIAQIDGASSLDQLAHWYLTVKRFAFQCLVDFGFHPHCIAFTHIFELFHDSLINMIA